MNLSDQLAQALERARRLVAKGDDEAAKQAYLEALRLDSTHLSALNELGTLAYAGGFRSAARTAYLQAVQHHPGDEMARVNLANLLYEESDSAGAALHYQAALGIDPEFPGAHQGMARILSAAGERKQLYTGAKDLKATPWSASLTEEPVPRCPCSCWSPRAAGMFRLSFGSRIAISLLPRFMWSSMILQHLCRRTRWW
jgi:tetratricopeptide (TPR) repeat protein